MATLTILLDASVKGFVVLGVALALVAALRRSSAATRHLIVALALAAVIGLPVLSAALPSWRLPILPASVAARATERLAWHLEPPFSLVEAPPAPAPAPVTPVAVTPSLPPAPRATADAPPTPSPTEASRRTHWTTWLLAAWAGAAALVFAPWLLGVTRAWRLTRSALPLTSEPWARRLREATERLGIRRRVHLAAGPRITVPMTWGHLRPVILLPEEARTWSDALAGPILVHELAHVKRWDWLTQALGHLAAAFYFFNPFAWLAVRRLHDERERACDDLVLTAGSKASDYAEHLLAVARRARLSFCTAAAAVSMARPDRMEGRLIAILDAKRSRRTPGRFAVACATVGLAAVLMPLAMMRAASAIAEVEEPVAESMAAAPTESAGALQVALGHGGALRLVAIGKPDDASLGWWSPDGQPVDANPDWERFRANWPGEPLIGILEAVHPGARPPKAAIGPAGEEWLVPLWSAHPIRKPEGSDAYALTVGFGAGAWKTVGTLKPGESLKDGDLECRVESIERTADSCTTVHAWYTVLPETEFALVAVEKSGKETTLGATYNSTSDLVPRGTRHILTPAVFTNAGNVDHFAVRTRPRAWANCVFLSDRPRPNASRTALARARIYDPLLEHTVERFVGQLQAGDPAAAAFFAPEMQPVARRLVAWWINRDAAEAKAEEFRALREELAKPLSAERRAFFGGVRIWKDLGLVAPRGGDRAFTTLLRFSENEAGWAPRLLLERDPRDGWRAVGLCDGRQEAELFLFDTPATNPAWGNTVEVAADDPTIAKGCYLDIDSGRLLTPPQSQPSAEWIRETGVDVRLGTPGTKPSASGHYATDGYDLLGRGVTFEFWALTPERAKQMLDTTDSHLGSFGGGPFLFRTREGAIGVANSGGGKANTCTFRYKLLAGAADRAPGTGTLTPPAAALEPMRQEVLRLAGEYSQRIRDFGEGHPETVAAKNRLEGAAREYSRVLATRLSDAARVRKAAAAFLAAVAGGSDATAVALTKPGTVKTTGFAEFRRAFKAPDCSVDIVLANSVSGCAASTFVAACDGSGQGALGLGLVRENGQWLVCDVDFLPDEAKKEAFLADFRAHFPDAVSPEAPAPGAADEKAAPPAPPKPPADPEGAVAMMDPLKALFGSAVHALMDKDDPQGALDILNAAMPEIDRWLASLKGTDAEPVAAAAVGHVKLIQQALQDGNPDMAKSLMEGLNAVGQKIEDTIRDRAASTTRTAAERLRIGLPKDGAILIRGRTLSYQDFDREANDLLKGVSDVVVQMARDMPEKHLVAVVDRLSAAGVTGIGIQRGEPTGSPAGAGEAD